MKPICFYPYPVGKNLRAWLGTALLHSVCCVTLSGVLIISPTAVAQSESEHQSHHPGGAAPADNSAAGDENTDAAMPPASVPMPSPGASNSPMPGKPAAAPGMMAEMSKMMEGMMDGGARKEIYPELMSIPVLTTEKRTEIERLAEERIHAGMVLLQVAQSRLSHAIEAGDHDAADQALQLNREGNAQVASGVAAHRLIWEGTLPESVAAQWFTQNMSLAPSATNPHGLFGLSWFHYAAMFFLLAIAVSMVGIYFYKSRRAAALLAKLGAQSLSDTAVPPTTTGAPTAISHGDAKNATANPATPGGGGITPAKPAPINPDITPSKPNSWTGPLLVARIFQETSRVKTFRLIDPAGGTLPFNFLPGQFLTFTVSPHGKPVKRSYTIASSPTHRDFCEVTVKHEDQGLVSSYLNDRVHEGEILQVTGPSGKFTFAGQDGDSIVLIGGGVGVTPMMSVVRYLTDRSWPGDIFFIYGCKSDGDIIFREEIDYLKRRYSNLHVTLAVTHADPATWPYPIGRITKEGLFAAVPDLPSRHIHLCGPKTMMDGVKLMLAELGVQAQQIEVEVFVGKEVPKKFDVLPPLSLDPGAAATPQGTSIGAPPAGDPVHTSTVTFAKSNKTAPLSPSQTILEAAEEVGVNIEYSCREGTCGICKTRLLSGTVTMEVEDGLEVADKAQNIILACQAKATADVSVEA